MLKQKISITRRYIPLSILIFLIVFLLQSVVTFAVFRYYGDKMYDKGYIDCYIDICTELFGTNPDLDSYPREDLNCFVG